MNQRFETFTVLIAKINRNLRRLKNQEMAEYDLRGAQVMCLYYLALDESLTAAELCERCEEDKATISRSLDHLEKCGFVLRSASGTRRYKSPLTLTTLGHEVGVKVIEKVSGTLDKVSEIGAGITDEDRATFYRCLGTISDSLEQIANEQEQ